MPFKKSWMISPRKVGKITEKLESLQGIRDEVKNLGEKYQQIQKAHMQAIKELEDIPEGAANQLADLTTAIEGFGILANEALKRLPFVNKVYSEELFRCCRFLQAVFPGASPKLVKNGISFSRGSEK